MFELVAVVAGIAALIAAGVTAVVVGVCLAVGWVTDLFRGTGQRGGYDGGGRGGQPGGQRGGYDRGYDGGQRAGQPGGYDRGYDGGQRGGYDGGGRGATPPQPQRPQHGSRPDPYADQRRRNR